MKTPIIVDCPYCGKPIQIETDRMCNEDREKFAEELAEHLGCEVPPHYSFEGEGICDGCKRRTMVLLTVSTENK